MKHLFLDTNVLIDFLSCRQPFASAAAGIFDLSLRGQCKLYVSAISFNNIYYILRRSLSHVACLKLLGEIGSLTEVVEVNKEIISGALGSGFPDFEDGIQFFCASSIPVMDVIVTRDGKGFKKSDLPVMDTQEALVLVKNIQ